MHRLTVPLLLAAVTATAAAQALRPFPATALRGELTVKQPPDVLLNGQPARLAPGARIRGADNLLQMSGALVGVTLAVNYTLDPYGLLHDVWILSDGERAVQPWPRSQDEARAWTFNAAAQTWTRP